MGSEMISMLSETYSSWKTKRLGGRRDKELPDLTRVAGGFHAWSEKHGDEFDPWGGFDETDAPDVATAASENAWRAKLDRSTNSIVYEHVLSGRIARVRPPGAQVLVEKLGGEKCEAKASASKSLVPLFEGMESDDEDDAERQEREAKEALEVMHQEASQSRCDLCKKLLLQPLRLTRCRCALCACCVEATVRYTRHCPVCDSAVDVKAGKACSDASNELLKAVEDRVLAGEVEIQGQVAMLQQLVEAREANHRIVLQYGNTSSGRGSKRSYTTFLKPVLTEGKALENSVVKVDFNINPGYSKPTATSKEQNDKALGFTFEYAMARAYPCYMTVHFRPELSLPKLVIEYCVSDEPKTSRRVLIQPLSWTLWPQNAPKLTLKDL